jgi:acyl-CoA synthetase (AMP-forming)/AMP-acid ligase II
VRAAGNLIFLDRRAESIRVKGEFVPIEFVEDHFTRLPGVQDVAVWRHPSELVGGRDPGQRDPARAAAPGKYCDAVWSRQTSWNESWSDPMISIALRPGDSVGPEVLADPIDIANHLADHGVVQTTGPWPVGTTAFAATGAALPSTTWRPANRPTPSCSALSASTPT